MSTKLELRDYQRQAVDAVSAALKAGHKSIGCYLPTGCGKSLVVAALVQRAIKANIPVFVVTHVKELVYQNAKAYDKLCGATDEYPNIVTTDGFLWGRDYTIMCSGLMKLGSAGNIFGKATFASIKTFYKRLDSLVDADNKRLSTAPLVIIDEVHRVDENSLEYGTLLKWTKKHNGRLVGLTATPYRQVEWLGLPFIDHVAVDMTTPEWCEWFISQNRFTPALPRTVTELDASTIRIKPGPDGLDYDVLAQQKQIVQRLHYIVDEIRAIKGKTIVFAPNVNTAKLLHEKLPNSGFIDASTKAKDRAYIIEQFKNNEINLLINVATLTTGFDVPDIENLVMLRATTSKALYQQIIGRGTRPAAGKTHLQLYDYFFRVNQQHLKPNKSTPNYIEKLADGTFNIYCPVHYSENEAQSLPVHKKVKFSEVGRLLKQLKIDSHYKARELDTDGTYLTWTGAEIPRAFCIKVQPCPCGLHNSLIKADEDGEPKPLKYYVADRLRRGQLFNLMLAADFKQCEDYTDMVSTNLLVIIKRASTGLSDTVQLVDTQSKKIVISLNSVVSFHPEGRFRDGTTNYPDAVNLLDCITIEKTTRYDYGFAYSLFVKSKGTADGYSCYHHPKTRQYIFIKDA